MKVLSHKNNYILSFFIDKTLSNFNINILKNVLVFHTNILNIPLYIINVLTYVYFFN